LIKPDYGLFLLTEMINRINIAGKKQKLQ